MLGTTVISAKMTEMMKLFGCKEEEGTCGLKEQTIRRKCTFHLANIVDLGLWQ